MIKEILFVGVIGLIFPAALPATMPLAAKVAVTTVAALPIDVAINTATGGTAGKTISGDTARARTKGDKTAAIKCDLYTVVAPYDYLVGVNDLGKDHCSRWERFEERGYIAADYVGLNK